ncbi:MAG: hypothetical protein LBI34_00095 [Puniceicoccales bacterium]|nr:hypothetical protein [Puniceicoccales bacterium]
MDDVLDATTDGKILVSSHRSIRTRKKAPDTSHSDLADASIGQMLSGLLDKIFVTQDLSELNTIATIMQRLLASSQQVLTLRGQLKDGVGVDCPREGLNMSTIRQLEKQLKLL